MSVHKIFVLILNVQKSLLTLKAPIATKVVCFSRLLKCLMASMVNSVDPDQTALGPRCLLLYLIVNYVR